MGGWGLVGWRVQLCPWGWALAVLEINDQGEKGVGKGRSGRENGSLRLICLGEQGGEETTALSFFREIISTE